MSRHLHTAAMVRAVLSRAREWAVRRIAVRALAGESAAMDTAIAMYEELAARRRPHDQVLYRLGVLRKERFERRGDRADADRSIEVLRQAAERAPRRGPRRAIALGELGGILRARFDLFGADSDLAEAIEVGRRALGTAGSPGSGYSRGWLLYKLAGHLAVRGLSTQEADDLAPAITLLHEAIAVVDGIASRGPIERRLAADCLADLCGLLGERADRVGDPADVTAAVVAGQAAIAVHPAGQPVPPRFLSSLALAKLRRHRLAPDEQEVEDAIALLDRAVAMTGAGRPESAILMANLSHALRTGHDHRAALGDLDGARRYIDAAMSASAAAAQMARIVGRRGALFEGALAANGVFAAMFVRADNPGPGMFDDMARAEDAAIARLTEAVHNAVPGDPALPWLQAELARALAQRAIFQGGSAQDKGGFQAAADAAQATVDRYPGDNPNRAAALLNLGQQLRNRAEYTGSADLTVAVAAFAQGAEVAGASPWVRINCVTALGGCAAQQGDTEEAYRRYEQAVRMLPEAAPESMRHEGREHWLSQLNGIASTAAAVAIEAGRVDGALELLESGRGILLSEWLTAAQPDRHAAITNVRALAADGPVVVVNLSRARCDAVTVTSEAVRVVPLTFDWYDATREAVAFVESLSDAQDPDTSDEKRQRCERRLSEVLGWLWDQVAEPVMTALDLAPDPAPVPSTRIWWVPTGSFSFLPLHAAGHHAVDSSRTVLARAVSSYAPTLRALAHSRAARSPADAEPERVFIVSMPTTPQADDLPQARAEADIVRRWCATHTAGVVCLEEAAVTRTAVLDELTRCSIAHFACHAELDPRAAAHSRLLLHDHAASPLTVADLARLRLPRAQVAYLSACSTAVTRGGMQDEALHPASAVLLAGFPEVVGTLWPVHDQIAARVARTFYDHAPGAAHGQDTPWAARALHAAILAARSRFGPTPSAWAAYVHAGR